MTCIISSTCVATADAGYFHCSRLGITADSRLKLKVQASNYRGACAHIILTVYTLMKLNEWWLAANTKFYDKILGIS